MGTHTYDATGDALRRQQNGIASLVGLDGVVPVNIQFTRSAHESDNLKTLRVLDRDAITVTARRGPRKPLVSDVFDALWLEALRIRAKYFGFTNADIILSPDLLDWIRADAREAYIVSRQETGVSPPPSGTMTIYGADVFVVQASWWTAHRRRFRGYILGEAIWDNVYASVLMCHANAAIENRRPLVRHEAHPQQWTISGPFAEYQRLLAAYDATYFSLWCTYIARLIEMRERGSSAEEEEEMARRTFRWPPPVRTRLTQAARNVKASFLYAFARGRPPAPK